jgi:hypothetical protein
MALTTAMAKNDRGQLADEVLDFVRLHRQTVGDLAIVRARWPEEALATALADLVASSTAVLGRPVPTWRRPRQTVRSMLAGTARRAVAGAGLPTAVAAAGLLVPLFVALAWGAVDPEAAARLVPVGLRRALVNGPAVLPVGAAVGLLAFGASGAGAVPGLVVLAWVGAIVGAVPAAAQVAGPAAVSSTVLLLASVPALLGMVVAAAAGLRLPAALARRGPSEPSLRVVATTAAAHLLVALPLLVLGTVAVEAASSADRVTSAAWAAWAAWAVAYLVTVLVIGRREPADR